MKTFIISDTHFNHKNIIEYTNRPFKSVEEMNERMTDLWNKTVKPEDFVIHLGDFALGYFPLHTLNGTKILIKGNHDSNLTKKQFDYVFSSKVQLDRLILSHKPVLDLPRDFINYHGHIHEKTMQDFNYINCSVEHTLYSPRPFANEVLSTLLNSDVPRWRKNE